MPQWICVFSDMYIGVVLTLYPCTTPPFLFMISFALLIHQPLRFWTIHNETTMTADHLLLSLIFFDFFLWCTMKSLINFLYQPDQCSGCQVILNQIPRRFSSTRDASLGCRVSLVQSFVFSIVLVPSDHKDEASCR